MDTFENALPGRRRRRKHSAEFKAQVIAACRTPGVSIAAVALEHRLNANLLRRWVVTEERARAGGSIEPRATPARAVANAAFVPVEVQTPMTATTQEIVIELRRGASAIKVTWPLSAATACASWLGQWLR
jgi:transposase-like protein